ncbi:MAG TPA: hypothetical protein VLX92_28145 [Kofleriaceae bacterium]|nr:hypothetical protein [Kofleriaceae bacterium]
MNDLSILFPLPTTQADFDAGLAASAQGVGGAMLPQAVFQADDQSGPIPYATLQAVGFRLDPCFGQLGPITDPLTCKNQLRVVFQPVTFDPTSGAFVQDAAVHAFYALTRDQLVAAVQELIAAREAATGDTDLGPLAPNPTLASQGLTGSLAQAYRAVITKYAGAANLVQFTSFVAADFTGAPQDVGVGTFWSFEIFQVAGGAATPETIPTMPDGEQQSGLNAGTDPLSAQFTPLTTSSDNISLIANMTQAMQASAADRQSSYDAALRIENPHDNSPNTIDCASCHMALPARQLVGAQLGMTAAGDSNAFAADPSIPTADLAQTTQLIGQDGALNIHAFSYRNTEPMINQRVINETAANLAYLAEVLP